MPDDGTLTASHSGGDALTQSHPVKTAIRAFCLRRDIPDVAGHRESLEGGTVQVTLANKVRLWFAAGCQAIGIILLLLTPTPDGTQYVYTSTQNGLAYEFWGAAFLAAAGVLGGISLYRFVRPKQLSPSYFPPAQQYGPQQSYLPQQAPQGPPQQAYGPPPPPGGPPLTQQIGQPSASPAPSPSPDGERRESGS